ncbi:MAG: Zn(2+)-responsive transcriptional regulator [SAR86 cluster bacterium]|uniref:Zn(2+)-responsive transcriptional regulator n=1 Tax=SAR86 cluster bacterium TaxID=2030880 RepID=A0A2A4MQF3_9GAMM|nr:MAG: Zn(2+)-responsive transcriptional regulator [SAR86 cluster bacterium]
MLKISQLAARVGLSAHTLRFYEKHGLIEASTRSESGYRLYNATDIRRIEFVKAARDIGFSLEDIAGLLSIRLDKESHTCQQVTDITQAKLDEVNAKIEQLKAMQSTLTILLESCCGGPEKAVHCSIMDALEARDGNTQHGNKHDQSDGNKKVLRGIGK